MKQSHATRRAAVAAFLLTLCAAVLVGGLLLADVNTRAVTFGQDTPPYLESILAQTGDDLPLPLPAPLQLLRRLWEEEYRLISQWIR